MSRVVQVRDVPDDVHDALVQAAAAEGLSLTRFLLREMTRWATRPEVARHNAEVIRETRAAIRSRVDRETILRAVHEGRGD